MAKKNSVKPDPHTPPRVKEDTPIARPREELALGFARNFRFAAKKFGQFMATSGEDAYLLLIRHNLDVNACNGWISEAYQAGLWLRQPSLSAKLEQAKESAKPNALFYAVWNENDLIPCLNGLPNPQRQAVACEWLADLLDPPSTEALPQDHFAEARILAKNMSRVCRTIIETVCDHKGALRLSKLAEILEWETSTTDANFQSRKRDINNAFKKTQWRLSRKSGEARLNRIEKIS